MDKDKLEERIIELIKESLRLQKLDKQINPIKLIDSRDRYYLIQCENGRKRKVRLVFLRYDKWIFYIHGMANMPKEFDKRHYEAKIRVKPEKKPKRDVEAEESKMENTLDNLINKERKRERQE